jgi:hypothetical protein
MITGYNDWDEALDEAYMRGIIEGRIPLPMPLPKMTVEDYGRSVTFSLKEILEEA